MDAMTGKTWSTSVLLNSSFRTRDTPMPRRASFFFVSAVFVAWWLALPSVSSLSAQDGAPIQVLRLNVRSTVVDLLARRPVRRPRVGLALSGGGARGFAQIGVLKVLVDAGIPIDDIVGSSMGAVIGGLYAAGYTPDELQHLALTTDWNEVLRDKPSRTNLFVTQKIKQPDHTVQIRFRRLHPYIPRGLSAGQKLHNLLTSLTATATYLAGGDFNQFPLPFRALAMDLTSGEKVVIDHGDLAEALRASIAVPFMFTPTDYQGRVLVDGGLVDPIPVDLVRSMGADIVIAVDTQSPLRTKDQLITPWDVVNQVIAVKVVQEARRQKERADVVITPDVRNQATFDFTGAGDLIRYGMESTLPHLPRLRELLAQSMAKPPDMAEGIVGGVTETGGTDGDRARIETAIRIKAGDPLTREIVRADLERIYELGRYADVEADIMGDSGSTRHIQYRVTENPVLTGIELSGLTVAHRDTLLARMRSRPGQTIDCRQLERDGQAILRWYHDQGYTLARFDLFDVDLTTGQVRIRIDEGRIAAIRTRGNVRTRSWVILRGFPLRVGEIFDSKHAERGLTDIYSTGLFETVTLEIERQDGHPTLVITVKERLSPLIELGGRYDREVRGEAALAVVDDNMFGTGGSVSGRVHYGNRRKRYEVNVNTDRVFKTYLTYRTSVYRYRDDRYVYDRLTQVGDFRETRTGGTFTLGQQLSTLGAFSITARVEGTTVRTLAGTSPTGRSDIRSVIVRSQVDNLDRYPFPTSGNLHDAWLEAAGDVFGGHQHYLRGFTSLEWYHTAATRVTIRPQFAFGMGEGEVPFSEQYSLGGEQSFFGYRDDQFRGTYLLHGSLLVRVRVLPRVYADVRYDVGGLWQRRQEFRWDDLRHGVGAGVNLDTPVGPFQVHYGSASFGGRRVYLSAGHRF